jgi:hypothetical protein
MTETPPSRLQVDPRPGAPRSDYDRRSILLRYILVLPVLILLLVLTSPFTYEPDTWWGWLLLAAQGFAPGFTAALGICTAAMITFRGRYPRWWFEAHAEVVRFAIRVLAYAFLLTDRYPSTDRETDVRVVIEAPPVDSPRDRRIAFLKPILVLPHVLLWLGAVAFSLWATVLAWLAVLLGMRLPGRHHEIVVEMLEYGLIIYAYAFLHLTDRYPKFSDAPRPRR